MEIGKLFSFDGRIGRGTFWKIVLGQLVIMTVVVLIANAASNTFLSVLALAFWAVMLWINIATHVRRWHDRGKSGAWYFILLVPIVGGIWALVELGFLAGTDGDNPYGAPEGGSPFDDASYPRRAVV